MPRESLLGKDDLYRTTIDMKKYSFGKGTYRYFKYPLPEIIQTLRENIYEKIVVTANEWSQRLNLKTEYPKKFLAFSKQMKDKGQTKPTPLILHYTKGDFNCLHQDINNDLIFPYQIVFGLSEKGKDYEGAPRMQTIPHIITVPKVGLLYLLPISIPKLGLVDFMFKHGVGKIEEGIVILWESCFMISVNKLGLFSVSEVNHRNEIFFVKNKKMTMSEFSQ